MAKAVRQRTVGTSNEVKTKPPEFMPCLGVISIIHKMGRCADVCSPNQLSLYQSYGWEVGTIEGLIIEDE